MTVQSQVMRARLHLLRELHAGSRAPGTSICVKDVVAALRLSHTPVREALAQLVGEGVVTEADGRNGFTVPRPGVGGYRQMTDLVALLLDGTLAAGSEPTEPPVAFDPVKAAGDPVAAVEVLVGRTVAASGNAYVARTIARLGLLLAPYRRAEPQVVPDWVAGLERLHAEIAAGRAQAAWQAYWQQRLRYADRIVDAVEHRQASPDIFQL